MKGSVTVHIAAPAELVWDLVSDVTRIGEFSPETFELADTLPLRLYWSVAGRARLRTNLDGMRATLEKMKAVAERG